MLFDQTKELNGFKLNLLPIDFLIRKAQGLYDTSLYNKFTNKNSFKWKEQIHFFMNQQSNTLSSIYIPGNLIIFILLNRIFSCIHNYKVSSFIRIYSFLFEYFVINVFSNITALSFLCS